MPGFGLADNTASFAYVLATRCLAVRGNPSGTYLLLRVTPGLPDATLHTHGNHRHGDACMAATIRFAMGMAIS